MLVGSEEVCTILIIGIVVIIIILIRRRAVHRLMYTIDYDTANKRRDASKYLYVLGIKMKSDAATRDSKFLHLYFNRNMETLQLTPETMEALERSPNNVLMCKDWSDLAEKVKLNPMGICFSYDELNYSSAIEIVNMVKTLSKLVGVPHDIVITVDVSKDTDASIIKVLQKSEIFGIIPRACDFGWDECEKGAIAATAKIPYWPKHIIEQMSGAQSSVKSKSEDLGIQLTPRQTQILNLVLERGSSNKVIARTLNISESTVKLHLGNIFKKYGVKNRTQLAVFAKK